MDQEEDQGDDAKDDGDQQQQAFDDVMEHDPPIRSVPARTLIGRILAQHKP